MTTPKTRYAFLDTETTSLASPWLDRGRRAWEVGYEVVNDLGQTEFSREFHIHIGDDLRHADPVALEIGRYAERYGVDIPVMSTRGAAYQIHRDLKDCIIIGSNPGFDIETLAQLLHSEGFPIPWRYHPQDVCSLVSGHVGRLCRKLDEAIEALELPVEPTDRHTALGDARVARWCWDTVFMDEGH